MRADHDVGVHISHDLAQIAADDLRGVGAAAVEHRLHLCRPAGRDIARERCVEDHDRDHLPVVDRDRDRLRRVQSDQVLYVGTSSRPLDYLLAPRSMVPVIDSEIDVLDLDGRSEAEQEQLQKRRHDQRDAATGVAQDRPQLLHDYGAQAHPGCRVHAILRRVTRIVAKKNKAPNASIARILGRKSGQMSPARKTLCSSGIR